MIKTAVITEPRRRTKSRSEKYRDMVTYHRNRRDITYFGGDVIKATKGESAVWTFNVRDADEFYFGKDFMISHGTLDITSMSAKYVFTRGRPVVYMDTSVVDVHIAALRLMHMIRWLVKNTESSIHDEELKDRCILSSTIAERMCRLVSIGVMPLCRCGRCFNGKVFAAKVSDTACMLMCDSCRVNFSPTECTFECLHKAVRTIIGNTAVDDMIYIAYAKSQSNVQVDKIRFADYTTAAESGDFDDDEHGEDHDGDTTCTQKEMSEIKFTLFLKKK